MECWICHRTSKELLVTVESFHEVSIEEASKIQERELSVYEFTMEMDTGISDNVIFSLCKPCKWIIEQIIHNLLKLDLDIKSIEEIVTTKDSFTTDRAS